MRLLATIGGAAATPLMDGSSVTLRRPVSSARLQIDDPTGATSPPSMLDAVIVKINNAALYSEEFDHATWLNSDTNFAISVEGDPVYGVVSAPIKLHELATTAQHFIYQRYLGAINSENVVWSVYLKADGRNTARLTILQRDWVTSHTCDVNLTTGAVTGGGAGTTVASSDEGDGWWRVVVKGNTGTGSNDAQGYVFLKDGSSYLGVGATGVHIWGAQWQSAQTVLTPYSATVETSTLFDGFVIARELTPIGGATSRVISLDCVDWNWRLDNPPGEVTKVYVGQSDQTIIIDALAACGLDTDITATTSTIASVETGITVAFDGRTMRQVLDEMVGVSGGVYWIQNRTLYYAAEASTEQAAWQINTDAPVHWNSWDVENLVPRQRQDFPLNSGTVVGPVQENGLRPGASTTDAASIAAIGTYHKKVPVASATTDGHAAKIVARLVAAGKDPRDSITFKFSDDFGRLPMTSVNQRIIATSARAGLSGDTFISREIRFKQRNAAITDFEVSAGAFEPSVTDLLQRLKAAGQSSLGLPQAVGALDFDVASSENVTSVATSLPNLDMAGDLSFFATIKVDSISADRTIVALDDGSNLGLTLVVTSFGLIQLTRTRASSNYQYSRAFPGAGFVAGETYRIMVVSDTVAAARFWVNGVEATTGGGSAIGGGAFDAAATAPFYVGRDNGGAYMDGVIGAVAVWGISIPETTALGVHNTKFSALPFANQLDLAWALDEFAVASSASGVGSIIDRSPNGYDGTPNNSPTGAQLVYLAG